MTARVPLTLGLFALVDDDDLAAVTEAGPWCAAPNGRTVYAQRRVTRPDGRATTQHLHAFLTGRKGTDHRNGDGLDNRRANLRPATHSQNMANKRLYRSSTSGFKGVTFRRDSRRWAAQIQANGHHRHLGYYATPEEAAAAYDAAAVALFGEFARPNFPNGVPA